jgi:hypothetical protein
MTKSKILLFTAFLVKEDLKKKGCCLVPCRPYLSQPHPLCAHLQWTMLCLDPSTKNILLFNHGLLDPATKVDFLSTFFKKLFSLFNTSLKSFQLFSGWSKDCSLDHISDLSPLLPSLIRLRALQSLQLEHFECTDDQLQLIAADLTELRCVCI